MRSNLVPLLITIFAVAAIIAGYFIFAREEGDRYRSVHRIVSGGSDARVGMTVAYTGGPIAREEYRMEDKNGVSTAVYRIAGTNGKVYTIESPPVSTYTVPFFFERVVADGIWKITNMPPLGDTSKQYTLAVFQRLGNQEGSRTVIFTDPHYLATTAGRQYHLRLSRNKPAPDLLKMSSTALADKRYETIVSDFRNFGTPGFRAKVAQVQAQVRAGR